MITDKILFGAAYYPEAWDKSIWREDARLMKEAGFNVVRLAEFAWYFMEPREGEFDFAWLDEAIGVLHDAGVSVILGTPTATIPAWMAKRYPNVMAMEKNGQRRRFGKRKDYCMNHPDFVRLSLRITEKMAAHYANDARVLGFQTDNEFSGSPCRCDICLAGFRKSLAERHGSIGKLNSEYGGAFWSTMYNSFDEIDWPHDEANPSFALDLKRFLSQVDVDYQAKQIAVLRRFAPGKPITHNFMSHYCGGVDYFKLAADLDVVSWDSYPGITSASTFGQEIYGNAITWAFKRKNFIVMEQQSGPGGWEAFVAGVAPGQMALLAWQSIARGADGILFFRWRTSIAGMEQYWHGIINHDNVPRRRYHEVAEMGKQVQAVSKKLLGTTPAPEVGVYFNYAQIWAMELQRQNWDHPVNFKNIGEEMVKALGARGVDIGIFTDSYDLHQYKLILCPPIYLTHEHLVSRLQEFVRQGGHLVLTARTGVKTANNKCVMQPLPGAFRALAGVEVDEYAAIPKDAKWEVEIDGQTIATERIREHLLPGSDTEVIGKHLGGYMAGLPAITRHKYGKGTVWYVGTLPGIAGWSTLFPAILQAAGVANYADLPAGVEIARRAGGGRSLTFVLNHNDTPRTVKLAGGGTDLLNGKKAEGQIELPGFGVAVLDA